MIGCLSSSISIVEATEILSKAIEIKPKISFKDWIKMAGVINKAINISQII
jgi:hypothetical protein